MKIKTNKIGEWFDKGSSFVTTSFRDAFAEKTNPNTDSQILVTGLISGDWDAHMSTKSHMSTKYKMPVDYMKKSQLPHSLIKQLIDNGWTSEEGNVYFPEDFQPEPVKGEDGNIYLVINDKTPQEDVVMKYSMRAMELLYEENMSDTSEAVKTITADIKRRRVK